MRNEVKSGIILSVCVILIIVIVYFTTAVFMTGEIGNKKVSKTNNTTESSKTSSSNETSYENMIIASKTFNMLDETYMVIFFSKKNVSESLSSALTSYDSSNNDVKLYKVNVDEVINNYVKGDTDNLNPTSSKDLKIKNNALITISNGSVSSYINDDEEIIDTLK